MKTTNLPQPLSIDGKQDQSSKRFRPSIQCQHVNQQNNERCSADGFMECVHCDEVCCLHHITEHQNELKKQRDELVREADDVYLTIVDMEVTDTREQLRTSLVRWKTQMFENIETTYKKLLDDLEQTFVAVKDEFDMKKTNLTKEFNEMISQKLERLSTKSDFYPHELIELKSSLQRMSHRIVNTRTSLINIEFDHEMTSAIDDNQNFQLPQIITQNKPDVERLINGFCLRQFLVENEKNSDENTFLCETSDRHLLIYDNQKKIIQLFDEQQRIGLAHWPNQSTIINCIKWSSCLKTFLILCSRSLHSLDCCSQPFQFSTISQISSFEESPMKYLSLDHQKLLIKHGNGVAIDCYSLKKLELIQRWSKKDFYAHDDIHVDIHRIEFYNNSYLAMNVELNEETDALDIFFLPNLQHIRRIDNAYSILYLPLNNYWIIKMKNEHDNQMNFSLLDQHGQISRLNLNDHQNIYDLHLFRKSYLIVLRQNKSSLQIQWYYIDHF